MLVAAGAMGWIGLAPPAAEAQDATAVVDVPDVALRRAFEAVLNKGVDEPITREEMEGVHQLSAQGVQQLAGIEWATSLRELSLRQGSISDLSPLSSLSLLVNLSLYANRASALTPLADLVFLEELDLRMNGVSDLAGLGSLVRLQRLFLGNNAVTDLTALSGLTELSLLDLSYNRIDDLATLTGLDALTSVADLSLTGNQISDVTALDGLESLRRLSLGDNGISDLNEVRGLASMKDQLHWLALTKNQISDLTPLAEFHALRGLDLGETSTSALSRLPNLVSLRELYLGGNDIVDVGPLSGLTSLRKLYLSFNRIIDVTPLSDLRLLRQIYLHENYITDLTPMLTAGDDLQHLAVNRNPLSTHSVEAVIPALIDSGVDVKFDDHDRLREDERAQFPDPALRRLVSGLLYKHDQPISVSEVQSLARLVAPDRDIEELGGLESAESLRHLDLRGNQIADVSSLADLAALRSVFLGGNAITDVAPLAGLRPQVLSVDGNAIEDIGPLTAMESLRWLAIDHNGIRTLPRLECCLEYLYVSGNLLTGIMTLENQRSLVELDLSRNDVSSLSPLAEMDRLTYLHMNDNDVSDLAPLNFDSLAEIHMRHNAVEELSPLLMAENLLMVDVRGNPLPEEAIGVLDVLRERGATVLAGESVPYLPSTGNGRIGFVRVINHSDADGEVFVEAVDDAGVPAGPVRLMLGARQAVHFNSADLENGSVAKGLEGGIGPPTAGDWRLALISPLDIEVLSYVRTEDGFVTAMHDVAADAVLPTLNPGSNENQHSILRVVNPEAEAGRWTTGGYDDSGKWHPMAGSIEVRPGTALTLTAAALENAHGLGDGQGKWRLRVRGFPWYAMSLLESPTGHLTNLSTAPDHSVPLPDGGRRHRLPLFPAASAARVGFARVINRSPIPGRVTIEALDDSGTRFGPVSLDLGAGETVHFNSHDLEAGNPAKGLSGGVGLGQGDWRLELTSAIDLQVLSYIRTADGFLTSMHDVAPRTEDGSLWIPFFNPGSNSNQASHLRLMNYGAAPAEATVTGVDDAGRTSRDVARVTVPPFAVRTLTAAELETGNAAGLTGALGDGKGKWRLLVEGGQVDAMSLLSLPTGHHTNLATTPRHPQEGQE